MDSGDLQTHAETHKVRETEPITLFHALAVASVEQLGYIVDRSLPPSPGPMLLPGESL